MAYINPISGTGDAQTATMSAHEAAVNAAIAEGDASLLALASAGDPVRLDYVSGNGQAATYAVVSAQAAITLGVGQPLQFAWQGANTATNPTLTVGGVTYTLRAADGATLVAGDLRDSSYLGRIHAITTIRILTLTRIADVPGLGDALNAKAAVGHTHPASAISDATAAGLGLLTAADASAQRTALGLGTAATRSAGSFAAAAAGITTTERNKLAAISERATRNSEDAFLLARENHTGTQPISAVEGLTEALAQAATVADMTAAKAGREPAPGLQPSRFLRGIVPSSARWSSANRVNTAAGPALVVTGPGYVVLDEPVPVHVDDIEEVRFAVTRTVAVIDPAGDGVRFGVACYDAAGVPLAGESGFVSVGADVTTLNSAGAVTQRRGTVSRTLAAGVDVILPSDARMIAPAVRAYGENPGLGVLQCERHRVLASAAAGTSVGADAAGTLADRDDYDDEASGFVYLRTDGASWEYYTRIGAAGTWAGPQTFQGPAGAAGDDGDLTTFANEAAALTWLGAATRPDGLVISVAGQDYVTAAGGSGPGLLAVARPRAPSYPQQWGFTGTGTQSDTQKFQNALTDIGAAGGGELTLPPGDYALASLTPTATNWDNRYALTIRHDDVAIRALPGAKLTMGEAEAGHMILIGQRADGSNTPQRVRLSGLHLDMARDDKPGHDGGTYGDGQNSAISVSDGCDHFLIENCLIENGVHYGIGVQRSEINHGTIRGCTIIGSGGDALDWKNDTGHAIGNIVDGCTAINWGLDPAIAASGGGPQAGFDFRSGIIASNLTCLINDGEALARDGIRIQGGSRNETPWQPTQLAGFSVIGESKFIGTTRGLRMIARWGKASGGHVRWVGDAISISNPECRVSDVDAYFCTTGARLWADSSVTPSGSVEGDQVTLRGIVARNNDYGFVADGIDFAQLADCYFIANTIGLDIRSGTAGTRIFGGGCFGNTTDLQDLGGNTSIYNVAGLTARTRRTQEIDVSEVGVTTYEIEHQLGVTPVAEDVTLTMAAVSGVYDFAAIPMIVAVNSSTIRFAVSVITASATPDAVANVLIDTDARKIT